jgi:glycosyltransferase involved in cell wall biosynthesis
MELNPVNVLFVVPDLPVGGAERHLTLLVSAMDKSRFRPSVICIGEEGELFGELPNDVDARALHLGGKEHMLRSFRELAAIMRQTKPDVVVVRGYNAEVLGRLAAMTAGVRHTVVWVHSLGDIGTRTRPRSLAERVLSRFTTRYFGVAEAQRNHIVNDLYCPDRKIRIIHNGVDSSCFYFDGDRSVLVEFDIDLSDPVVGIIAALRPEKDHQTLLRAARMVIDDIPAARFLIVGDGDLRANLESLTIELGITDNVRFVGTRSDVRRLLCAMDVFTLTSSSECSPISVLEAMACARPVVCSDVGGIPEMVEDGVSGYLVPPKNPGMLAARLKDLLASPELARRMGEAGRRRVESDFRLSQSHEAAQKAIEAVAHQFTSATRPPMR